MNKHVGTIMGVALLATRAWAAEDPLEKVSWAKNIKFKGDLRYRFEYIDEEGKEARQRDRIRARLAAEAVVNPNVTAGIGVSSGSEDPVSSNQSLTDGFSRKNVALELAYFDWQMIEQLALTGGKFKNPFTAVSDLVWDGDLNPEGLALTGKTGNDQVELTGGAGYLWVVERSGENDDTMCYVGQAAAKVNVTPEVYIKVGGGYYGYDNLEGYDVIDYEKKNNAYGNTTANRVVGSVTNKIYATEYQLVEAFAEIGVWVGIPLTAFGHYVVNTEADSQDTGYQAGVSAGKAKNPRTYEVGYSYAELEKDAVVGAFTDSDRWGGGTDGRGHKFLARYQMSKNWQIGGTYFLNERAIADAAKKHDYDRVQLDLVAKF